MHGDFAGVADFLVLVEEISVLRNYHYYEVWDTKLARVAQLEFLLQPYCDAGLLEALRGYCGDPTARVVQRSVSRSSG